MKKSTLSILLISSVVLFLGCSVSLSSEETHPSVTGTQSLPVSTLSKQNPTPMKITLTPDQRESPVYMPDMDISTSTIIMAPSSTEAFIKDELHCNTYIETTWGKGPEQFGYDFEGRFFWSPGRVYSNGPYPIQFDDLGNMYVPDHVNNRILIYSKGDKTPRHILLQPFYQYDGIGYGGKQTSSWYNISVSHNNIYVFFQDGEDGKFKLGIMTMQGEELQIVDLSEYVISPPIGLSPILTDGADGIYLWAPIDTREIFHFSSQFILKTTLTVSNVSWVFEKMIIGWDGKLYTYGPLDLLRMWGDGKTAFEDGLEPETTIDGVKALLEVPRKENIHGGNIVGVDRESNVYLILEIESEDVLARVNMDTWNTNVYDIPSGFLSLSPDGLLYILSFDQDDSSIPPKILQCYSTINIQ